ncbi:MAG: ABC transporter permease [Alphaproteobacteria bacterium]
MIAEETTTGRRPFPFIFGLNFLFVPILVIFVVLSIYAPNFLTAGNIENILRLACIYMVLGVGQTMVMTSANIDLSIGSMSALIMALVGTVVLGDFAFLLGQNVLAGIVLALVLGTTFGAVNGLIVTKFKVPSLLATLGVLVTYRGIVQEYMYGSYHVRFPESLRFLGQGSVLGIPTPVIVALLVAVAGWLILHRSRFGRHVIAVGSNEQAAIRAGINVDRVKIGVFALQGFLVGLAAILFMGRLNSAHPSFGIGMELHIIAGVVLGGTLLFGGYGTIIGTVLGMTLIGVLENGLLLAGAGFFWQQIFLGLLIIASVGVQLHFHRRRSRK